MLCDILDKGEVDSKYYLSEKTTQYIINRGSGRFCKVQSFEEKGKSKCLLARYQKLKGTGTYVFDIKGIRALTLTECARLQTVPIWYKWIVSNNQTYKMLGNGWTIEIIKHILQYNER